MSFQATPHSCMPLLATCVRLNGVLMAQGSQVSEPCYAVVVKSAKIILFWFKGFLSAIFVLQEVVQETYFCLTQEQSSTGRALRVAGKSLAQVMCKTGALNVRKEPITILAEENQTCWPNYTAHNNILPILIRHCFQFMMIFTTSFHDPV